MSRDLVWYELDFGLLDRDVLSLRGDFSRRRSLDVDLCTVCAIVARFGALVCELAGRGWMSGVAEFDEGFTSTYFT